MVESVKEAFNYIAPSWYNYRHYSIFTKELHSLAERWQNGKLLNLGCAHGPDFLPFVNNFKLYGIDFSHEMLKYADKYALKFGFNVELSLADIQQLPYPDNHFSWAISVATYHHIYGRQEKLKTLIELKRVLKPGSEAFITVWNRWQPNFWFSPKEVYLPWRMKNKTLYRYYYLFSYKELEKLARKAGFQVLKSYPENSYHFPLKQFSKNICLLLRKNG